MQLSSWDFDQQIPQPVTPRKRNSSLGLDLLTPTEKSVFYQSIKPTTPKPKSSIPFQQKIALDRQYIKLKKRESELLNGAFALSYVKKPRGSQQEANQQWLKASQHYNKSNRQKKIPSTQDDEAVKRTTQKVIQWNLYNIYLRKKEELEKIQKRLDEIMTRLYT